MANAARNRVVPSSGAELIALLANTLLKLLEKATKSLKLVMLSILKFPLCQSVLVWLKAQDTETKSLKLTILFRFASPRPVRNISRSKRTGCPWY